MFKYFTFNLISPTTAVLTGAYIQDVIPSAHQNCNIMVDDTNYTIGWTKFNYDPVSKVLALKI